MIAYIKGKVVAKATNFLIVETGGIGYKVFVPPSCLDISVGAVTELFLHHKSTDEGQSLYGFQNFENLRMMELLISVSGVGPKMGMGILSFLSASAVETAIFNKDVAIFTKVSGVGKKLAERIILELKSKVGEIADDGSGDGSQSTIFDALAGLGYGAREIRDVLPQISAGSPAEQIKQALKLLQGK